MEERKRRFLWSDKFEHWIVVYEGDRDWHLAQSLKQVKYEQWKYNALISEINKGK